MKKKKKSITDMYWNFGKPARARKLKMEPI